MNISFDDLLFWEGKKKKSLCIVVVVVVVACKCVKILFLLFLPATFIHENFNSLNFYDTHTYSHTIPYNCVKDSLIDFSSQREIFLLRGKEEWRYEIKKKVGKRVHRLVILLFYTHLQVISFIKIFWLLSFPL